MLDFISKKLQKSIAKMNAKTVVYESDLLSIAREVKFALLEADVNFLVVKNFINKVKKKVIGSQQLGKLNSSQFFVKIFKEELIGILGGETKKINLLAKPKIMMMVGLQGSGKTTSCAKLAKFLQKKEGINKPLLIACDVHRPAAIDQLKQLGKQLSIDVYINANIKDAVLIAKEGVKFGKDNGYDCIIIDTAGRLAINETLMHEVVEIKNVSRPSDIFFVVDALSGQDAINVAEAFNNQLQLTGTIITKLDSDARGGAALSITNVLKIPIYFIGDGEKINNFNVFHPERMANRILGMGDFLTLIEKAEEAFDHKKSEKMFHRMQRGNFDLNDLMEQLAQIKKIGKMKSIIKLIPGLGKKISGTQIDQIEDKFRIFTILINSMTKKERKNPKLLKNSSIKKRIINGSGRTAQEYNRLVNEFEKMVKKMKEMKNHMGKNLPF